MRRIIIASTLLLGGIMGESMADCSSTRVEDLSTLLNNKLVCGNEAGGSDQWQEEHRTGGVLWEVAKGADDPADPSHQAGSWSVSGNNTADAKVSYTYSSGSSYTFSVHENTGGSYSFCNGGAEAATATIIASADCGF